MGRLLQISWCAIQYHRVQNADLNEGVCFYTNDYRPPLFPLIARPWCGHRHTPFLPSLSSARGELSHHALAFPRSVISPWPDFHPKFITPYQHQRCRIGTLQRAVNGVLRTLACERGDDLYCYCVSYFRAYRPSADLSVYSHSQRGAQRTVLGERERELISW